MRAEEGSNQPTVCLETALILLRRSVRVLVPSYYAVKNTWFPAVVSAICLLVHILVAPRFMGTWGIQGLVGSTLLSASLNLFLLLAFYPKFIGSLGYWKIFVSFVKFCLAGLVLAGICELYPYAIGIYGSFGLGILIPRALSLFTIISFAGLGYCVVSYLMKTEELHHTLNSFLGKVRRRLKRS